MIRRLICPTTGSLEIEVGLNRRNNAHSLFFPTAVQDAFVVRREKDHISASFDRFQTKHRSYLGPVWQIVSNVGGSPQVRCIGRIARSGSEGCEGERNSK